MVPGVTSHVYSDAVKRRNQISTVDLPHCVKNGEGNGPTGVRVGSNRRMLTSTLRFQFRIQTSIFMKFLFIYVFILLFIQGISRHRQLSSMEIVKKKH